VVGVLPSFAPAKRESQTPRTGKETGEGDSMYSAGNNCE
jgi:hypothetical protein